MNRHYVWHLELWRETNIKVDNLQARGILLKTSLLAHFEPQLEHEFQHSYFERIRPTLRALTLLLAAIFALYTFRDYTDTQSLFLSATQDGAPTLFFLLLFALTWHKGLSRVWQIVFVVGGLFTTFVSLNGLAYFLSATHPGGIAKGGLNVYFSSESLFFGQQMRLLMVCFSTLRLQFRQALLLQASVLIMGAGAFLAQPALGTLTQQDISRFLQPTAAIFLAVLLAALIEEQLSRRAFLANHLLEEERNDERRKRQQTEDKLHVLAQAIGGIVHDLGNPLTMVQMGANTLDTFIDMDSDKATLKELTETITSGSQMLNYLRLSLIEQTRVLEGKPTSVDLKPVNLRPIVQAGLRFQKPNVLGGREVNIEGSDIRICADEMKMVTVFMNFIGNALKYSDGEIQVRWRPFEGAKDEEKKILIAVLDMGRQGKGITQNEAASLFTAFGRLETHSQIEGTGLGLLSVLKIAQAHGGQAYIEGTVDGTAESPVFSTLPESPYPSMLTPEFRTAFVVTCSLAS